MTKHLTGVLTVYQNNGVFNYERMANFTAQRSGELFQLPYHVEKTESKGTWKRFFHGTEGEHPFLNDGQIDAMAKTPFDVTIFTDADFLPVTDALAKAALEVGPDRPLAFLQHKHVLREDLRQTLISDVVNPFPIWSTVLIYYMDRSPNSLTNRFFHSVRHVRDHWVFYAKQIGVPDTLYRNDFAFAIAGHRLGISLRQLGLPDWYRCVFYFDVPCEQVTPTTVSMKGFKVPYDVHCMHKPSLLQVIECQQ